MEHSVEFRTACWGIVVAARDGAADESRATPEALCISYWYPVCAFIRRQVEAPQEAEDLIQEFFVRFLQPGFLQKVDPTRGWLWAYLLACCKHFLANERDRAQIFKRDGIRRVPSLDLRLAVERFGQEPATMTTPERLFERAWVLTLLQQVVTALESEYRTSGREHLFTNLRDVLIETPGTPSYALLGNQLGMTEAAVKKAVQRLRQRYRELLHAEVGAAGEHTGDIDDEIRSLFFGLATPD